MTLKNTSDISDSGNGIYMINATLELFDVALKGNINAGIYVPEISSEAIVVATRCEFANNRHGAN